MAKPIADRIRVLQSEGTVSPDLDIELLFVAEVVDQSGLAEAGGLGELRERGAVVAVLADELQGELEDLRALGDPFGVLSGPGHPPMIRESS